MRKKYLSSGAHSSSVLHLRASAIAWLMLLAVVPVLAQSGGGYDLSWSTVDSGGYTFSTGGGYSLGGTIGQPDAGLMAGGDYTLAGGFWPGGAQAALENEVCMPVVMRAYP